MTPKTEKGKKKKKVVQKTAWQTHGGALFDSLSGAALTRLKDKLGLNTEVKFLDSTNSSTLTTTLTQKAAMLTIPQGATSSTREGASIRLTAMSTRINLYCSAAQTQACTVRIMIVANRQAGAAVVANVLQSTTDVTSMLNHDISQLGVDVLKDAVVTLGGQATSNSTIYFSWVWQPRNHHIVYTDADTAGTVANILEGAINIMCMHDGKGGSAPALDIYRRLEWVDN